jgi:hypothetical protein
VGLTKNGSVSLQQIVSRDSHLTLLARLTLVQDDVAVSGKRNTAVNDALVQLTLTYSLGAVSNETCPLENTTYIT